MRTAGKTGGSQAFNLDSRRHEDTDYEEELASEGEGAGETTERRSVGTVKLEEKKMQLLPDSAVPLGLIADLSLNNTKKTSTKDDDDTDDDNMVRAQ